MGRDIRTVLLIPCGQTHGWHVSKSSGLDRQNYELSLWIVFVFLVSALNPGLNLDTYRRSAVRH